MISKSFKPCPLAYALQEPVVWENEGFWAVTTIVSVTHFEWVASIVLIVKMDRSIQICRDDKVMVNHASNLDNHTIPKTEDLQIRIERGQKFTKQDISHTYQ